MVRTTLYLICCILSITSIATASGNTHKLDLSSPRSTVHAFVGSINQYNFEQAALCVDGADSDKMTQLSEWEADLKKVHATIVVNDLQSKIDGAEAIVTSTITTKVGESQQEDSPVKSHLRLRRHSEKWQIYLINLRNSNSLALKIT